jgi:hypothetical protein
MEVALTLLFLLVMGYMRCRVIWSGAPQSMEVALLYLLVTGYVTVGTSERCNAIDAGDAADANILVVAASGRTVIPS